MHAYEIRILKNDRDMSLIFSSSQPDDEAAIRVAKKLAADRPLEVWRDLECICRQRASSLAAHQRPETKARQLSPPGPWL